MIDPISIPLPCLRYSCRNKIGHDREDIAALQDPEAVIGDLAGGLSSLALIEEEVKQLAFVYAVLICGRLRLKDLMPQGRHDELCVHDELFQYIPYLFLHGRLWRCIPVILLYT